MQPEFWLERWQANLIGFHQDEINDYLLRYWPRLGVTHDSRILVPLCGKSLDMLWLAEQGHPVIGIEISQLAVESFFSENGLTPGILKESCGLRYTSGQIEILCADYFALTRKDIGEVAAFYDRAALIALTPAQRPDYVAHLGTLISAGTHGLPA
jgi:thiopurine S-methyltransferase